MHDGIVSLTFRLIFEPVFLAEAFHTSGGIYNLLFSGIERVAVGADFHLQIAAGRPGLDLVAAAAGDGYFLIFGMYTFLHNNPLFYAILMC